MSIKDLSRSLASAGVQHVVISASDMSLKRVANILDMGITNALADAFGVTEDDVFVERKSLTADKLYNTEFVINTGSNVKPVVRFLLKYDAQAGTWPTIVHVAKNHLNESQGYEKFTAPWFIIDLLGLKSSKRGVNISTLPKLLRGREVHDVIRAFEDSAKKAVIVLKDIK